MSMPILLDNPPDDDWVQHVGGMRCVCKPYQRPVANDERGRRVFVIVHYRLDGDDPNVWSE
jgi:hypothetical protein